MSCGSLGGKGFGGEWIHACVWLSLFTAHLKLPQQSLLAIPQCEINRKKKNQRCDHRATLPCSLAFSASQQS